MESEIICGVFNEMNSIRKKRFHLPFVFVERDREEWESVVLLLNVCILFWLIFFLLIDCNSNSNY